MIRKSFRTPLLRRPEGPAYNDEVSEPEAKKRRISSNKGDVQKVMGPQLVFKTPGISSLPRKPLIANENLAGATRPFDGLLEGYYNVLWYVHFHKWTHWSLMVVSVQAELYDQEAQDLGRRWHFKCYWWACPSPRHFRT